MPPVFKKISFVFPDGQSGSAQILWSEKFSGSTDLSSQTPRAAPSKLLVLQDFEVEELTLGSLQREYPELEVFSLDGVFHQAINDLPENAEASFDSESVKAGQIVDWKKGPQVVGQTLVIGQELPSKAKAIDLNTVTEIKRGEFVSHQGRFYMAKKDIDLTQSVVDYVTWDDFVLINAYHESVLSFESIRTDALTPDIDGETVLEFLDQSVYSYNNGDEDLYFYQN